MVGCYQEQGLKESRESRSPEWVSGALVLALRWGRPSSSGRSRGFTGERHGFPLVMCAALLLKN